MDNNEVYIDFVSRPYQQKTSKTGKILLSILVLSVVFAYVYMYIQAKMHPFFVYFWSIYGILGLYQVFTGKSFISIFGKAYIKINRQEIIYKPNLFKKKKIIDWQDIVSLKQKAGYLLFENRNAEELKLPYSNMEYAKVQEVKSKIEEIAKEKGIKYQ